MVNILCIGQYNRTGRFTMGQWKCFIKWCEIMCNGIIIYTRMRYETVISRFPLYSNINILEKPDELLDVQAYETLLYNFLINPFVLDTDVSRL